jgi:chromosomal replication initiation ATPase DnaA
MPLLSINIARMNPAIIDHMVDTTAKMFGVTPEAIKSPSRERACVIARNIVADIAYNQYLFTFMAIGKVINRHYSTVIKNLDTFHNDCKAMPRLRYLKRQVLHNTEDYLQTLEGSYISK